MVAKVKLKVIKCYACAVNLIINKYFSIKYQIKHQIDNSIEYNTIFSCYTTVYIYYMFIMFTEATYLMTDEPPYCTVIYFYV